MPQSLTDGQIWTLLTEIQRTLEATLFNRVPVVIPEEKYVGSIIRPVVAAAVQKYRDLTLLGEGGRRALPVNFLGFYFFPDLGIMHYSERVIAIEAKYVDFARGIGDLATAVGQGSIYACSGYRASLIVTIGDCLKATREAVIAENARLHVTGARWQICILRNDS